MEHIQKEIRRLIIAVNKIDGLYYQEAKKLGIKGNALSLLYALDDGEPHSQKQLCEQWLIPRTTMNTIVKEYVKNDLITLKNEEHSKEKIIVITPEGRRYVQKLCAEIYRAEQSAMTETLKSFSSQFISAMEAFASQLQKGFSQQEVNSDREKDL
ncbi:MAG: MarR family transcriptional regulator [Selenomonadales bacterium]|jgi:predicted transcriptional regulator|nr:MarR family transcriptional regulator [Clostridiales bacterium]PWM00255.1 MAG: MarR family transcriptional regulator [Selenomonadales bacterium]